MRFLVRITNLNGRVWLLLLQSRVKVKAGRIRALVITFNPLSSSNLNVSLAAAICTVDPFLTNRFGIGVGCLLLRHNSSEHVAWDYVPMCCSENVTRDI
jgi:hypothetical protein